MSLICFFFFEKKFGFVLEDKRSRRGEGRNIQIIAHLDFFIRYERKCTMQAFTSKCNTQKRIEIGRARRRKFRGFDWQEGSLDP